jgi:hypothetical protein
MVLLLLDKDPRVINLIVESNLDLSTGRVFPAHRGKRTGGMSVNRVLTGVQEPAVHPSLGLRDDYAYSWS